MARETAAQRKEREANVAEKYRRDFLVGYANRLLDLVYDYSNQNPSEFSVDRLDDDKFLFETTQNWAREFVLPRELTEYSSTVFYDLLEAEDALKEYEADRAEESRKANALLAAMKKAKEMFTEEERQLLGL